MEQLNISKNSTANIQLVNDTSIELLLPSGRAGLHFFLDKKVRKNQDFVFIP